MRNIGLARALSKLGYCSRSQAAELIQAGRVSLNGKITLNPEAPVHLGRDRLVVDGKAIEGKTRIYLMMNKPRRIVTTASDERGRDTVYTILRRQKKNDGGLSTWVAPVGRLDKASEGLLLLTNDSEWAARVTTPETHLDKTYHVQVATIPDETLVESLACEVKTKDGEVLGAKHVRLLRAGSKNAWLEIVLDEGKNRQIRRMLEAKGVEVLRLIRVAIGPISLGKLAKGEVRPLTKDEKLSLDGAISGRTL